MAAQHVPGLPSNQSWLKASTVLRLEHELTHLATKRLLGEMRLNLLDELVADCMGMVAALGVCSMPSCLVVALALIPTAPPCLTGVGAPTWLSWMPVMPTRPYGW